MAEIGEPIKKEPLIVPAPYEEPAIVEPPVVVPESEPEPQPA